MALHVEGAILAEYTVKPDGTGSFQTSLVLPILLVFFPSLPSSSLLSSLHKGQCSIVIESSGSRDNRWLYMELSALPLTGEVFWGMSCSGPEPQFPHLYKETIPGWRCF